MVCGGGRSLFSLPLSRWQGDDDGKGEEEEMEKVNRDTPET